MYLRVPMTAGRAGNRAWYSGRDGGVEVRPCVHESLTVLPNGDIQCADVKCGQLWRDFFKPANPADEYWAHPTPEQLALDRARLRRVMAAPFMRIAAPPPYTETQKGKRAWEGTDDGD